MTVELSQFFGAFFDESAEHLAEMESIFLAIDTGNPDDEDLNAAFRAAHSIKGGAGTFGFPDMAGVTHQLETLLDLVRHRELPLTREMVEILLEAGDAIGMQLAGHRDGAQVDSTRVETVCRRLQAICPQAGSVPAVAAFRPSAGARGPSRYRITFTPPDNFFNRMVNMEPIFSELGGLGEAQSIARVRAPDRFSDYDYERCLTSWEITLSTEATPDEVREVFMFVADDEEVVFEELSPAAGPGGGSAATAVEAPHPEAGEGKQAHRKGDAEASSIRVAVLKVDQLINQMGEMVINRAMLAQTVQHFDPVVNQELHHGMELLERSIRDMQECVMSIRMMPISYIFSRFPRLVHDLAAKLSKKVELKLAGETTELDRGLIEKLADPLTHLVRNSLDHGIESPAEREAAGKSAAGTVTLRASQSGGRIVIEVADDGAGLSRERILKKAREKGLPVSEETPDEELWQVIFAPGFSTADQVTDVSGRGVGMDVVMRNVQDMGGRVGIFSEPGAGSRVVVSLPLTLAILDGLSVQVGDEVFIVPINSIVESLQPHGAEVNEVAGRTCVQVRGNYLPLLRLAQLFGISGAVERPEGAVVMIVDAEGEQVALLVDALLSQHQVVIKSLEGNYRKVPGTAGATIMGDGKVALILDTGDLVRLWRRGRPFQARGERA